MIERLAGLRVEVAADDPGGRALATLVARAPSKLERVWIDERLTLRVGIGASSPDELRVAGALITRAADGASLVVNLLNCPLTDDAAGALIEGLYLGGYHFRAHPNPAGRSVATVSVIGLAEDLRQRGEAFAEATLWARELTNTRSSVKTPRWLAEQARIGLEPVGLRVIERDGQWLADQGFGGVLAVGGGSVAPPRLIEARWAPRRVAGRPLAAGPVVLVGKSITFDSGGINIKPLDSMNSMYTDMAAGAAVLATMRLIARLQLPIRVTALLPAAENAVSGSAMRQTDVVRHYGGRTSEVNNTDAEGRLVLADALAYATAKLSPSVLVDMATLTGAMKVSLGLRTGGLFATSDELAAQLLAAGAATGEPLWRLPLHEDYRPMLASDIADATNSPGNPGGINAALYLRPFTGGRPWAHLDIAGSARANEDEDEFSEGATGFGARLLAQWLIDLAG